MRSRHSCTRRGAFLLGLALLVLSLSIASPANAQSDYEFSLPTALVVENQNQTVTLVIDNSMGFGLAGFSLGVCSDPAVVTPLSVSVASDLALANGGDPLGFLQIEVLANGITAGCVINLLGNFTLTPATDNQVLDIEYQAVGSIGAQSALDFCDNLGVPPVSTVAVVQATSEIPDQVSGSLEVVGSIIPILRIESTQPGRPGEPTTATVRVDSGAAILSLSSGFSVTPGQLSIDGVSLGSDLAAVHGGSGPDLLIVDLSPSGGFGATVDCTISTSAPFETLPSGNDRSLFELSLVVGQFADSPCTQLPISFSSTLGSPQVPIEVTTTDGLQVPTVIDGAVTLGSLNPRPPSGGITLSAENRVTSPGSNTTVEILLDTDLPVSALSFGLAYSDLDVSLVTSTIGSSLAALRCGAGPEFFSSEILTGPQPGVTMATLFEIQPPFFERELPSGSDLKILSLEFSTVPVPINTVTDLLFSDLLGSPPVALEVTVGTQAQIPTVVAGSIGFGVGFSRGDCNDDGGLDVADAIFLLGFLFSPGTPPPICSDACDANDDGGVNIADAIGILVALFTLNAPPLPPPVNCGSDATPDGIDCASTTSC